MENEFGFVGIASRLVAFDSQYQNIVYNLLGRTVVAEDLDCGIAMARKYRNAFRIVTLDGQVINRGGSMTGGSTSRSAGVLSRAAELEQLTARSAAMQAKLAEAKQAEEDTARELGVAEITVRRDFEKMESEGKLKRVQGGAPSLEELDGAELTMTSKLPMHMHGKEAVAQYAADLVRDGECVFIDGGTTMVRFA